MKIQDNNVKQHAGSLLGFGVNVSDLMLSPEGNNLGVAGLRRLGILKPQANQGFTHLSCKEQGRPLWRDAVGAQKTERHRRVYVRAGHVPERVGKHQNRESKRHRHRNHLPKQNHTEPISVFMFPSGGCIAVLEECCCQKVIICTQDRAPRLKTKA